MKHKSFISVIFLILSLFVIGKVFAQDTEGCDVRTEPEQKYILGLSDIVETKDGERVRAITVNENEPFVVSEYTSDGTPLSSDATVLRDARFTISGFDIDALQLGMQKSVTGETTSDLRALMSRFSNRDVRYFDVDESGVLFDQDIDCIQPDGPFIAIALGSQLFPDGGLIVDWDVTVTQGENVLDFSTFEEEQLRGLYYISHVGSDPLNLRLVDPETSNVYEYTLFPFIRSANFATIQNDLFYYVYDITAPENLVEPAFELQPGEWTSDPDSDWEVSFTVTETGAVIDFHAQKEISLGICSVSRSLVLVDGVGSFTLNLGSVPNNGDFQEYFDGDHIFSSISGTFSNDSYVTGLVSPLAMCDDFATLNTGDDGPQEDTWNAKLTISQGVIPVETVSNDQIEIVGINGIGDIGAEGVVIRNLGNTLTLTGWSIHDDDGNEFFFSETRFFSHAELIINSRAGQNTPIMLFWGSSESIWEEGDTLTVRDEDGEVQLTWQIPNSK